MTPVQDLAQLNERFAIKDAVRFEVNAAGFFYAVVKNPLAQGSIALSGAHVMSFLPSGAAHDVFWVSPHAVHEAGKAIRGGIPICWPWFGAHPTQPNTKPAHGFARTETWQVTKTETLPNDATQIRLALRDNTRTQALWNHRFLLEAVVTFDSDLGVDLTTHNLGEDAFLYTAALHHYFRVSDVEAARVTGLENTEYFDKTDGFQQKRQTEAVTFPAWTDRVYIDTSADCVIHDPLWQRSIRIRKENSHTTVVWNPGHKAINFPDIGLEAQRQFVCVETANAANDVIEVAAGSRQTLTAVISLEEGS